MDAISFFYNCGLILTFASLSLSFHIEDKKSSKSPLWGFINSGAYAQRQVDNKFQLCQDFFFEVILMMSFSHAVSLIMFQTKRASPSKRGNREYFLCCAYLC